MGTTSADLECDVLVVGGGLAGCAAAIHLRAMGHRVVVVEKRSLTDGHYKQLCTHFIQPHAVPLLDGLGLSRLRTPEYAIATKAVFVTPGGVIETPGTGYDPDRPDSYALNLERRVLDPELRARARQLGVVVVDDTGVDGLRRDDAGWEVTLRDGSGGRRARARVVVAADGRRSRVATLVGNEAEARANDRVAVFGYFRGIEAPEDNRSVFIKNEGDLACVYPLVDGRTELVLFAERSRVQGWRGEERGNDLLRYFAGLEAAPDLANATLDSPVLGYTDYPNQIRRPVAGSVPFVGDAALSLDAMSGTGCGFSLLSADLLRRAFEGRSLEEGDVTEALADYESRYRAEIGPHVDGICADAVGGKSRDSERRMFETICGSAELRRLYLGLSGRLVMPEEFHRLFMRELMVGRRKVSLAPA